MRCRRVTNSASTIPSRHIQARCPRTYGVGTLLQGGALPGHALLYMRYHAK